VLFNTVLFTGNANPVLAQEIATHLGVDLGRAMVSRFSDGEVTVEIRQNVRARDVFVIQPTCAPTNERLMELLLMVDALKRASARRITAVIPYFGYARQDRRPRSTRVPISAKVVANLLETVGIERVLTMDLHADQIQGFFDIPVDNIYASPVLLSDLKSKNYPNLVVVSPDVGGVVRARALAKQLGCDLAIIDKRRPAVSIMSSMITQLRPSMSPMTCITSATLAAGRRLSMMARSQPSCLASARARTTPPTSGDTTTRLG
jgi:ribose-phosphate pyrophosphokinase